MKSNALFLTKINELTRISADLDKKRERLENSKNGMKLLKKELEETDQFKAFEANKKEIERLSTLLVVEAGKLEVESGQLDIDQAGKVKAIAVKLNELEKAAEDLQAEMENTAEFESLKEGKEGVKNLKNEIKDEEFNLSDAIKILTEEFAANLKGSNLKVA